MNKHLAGDCHKTNMFEQDSGNMVLQHGSELHGPFEMNTISVLSRQCNESNYIASLNQRIAQQDHELMALKENHQHLMQLYLNSQRREKILLRRLTVKERLIQNYARYVLNTCDSSNSTLLDPCVNLIIQLLCKEVQALKSQLKDTRNELSAWKFTPDSANGKRLMARCIKLHQENEEFGRIINQGKVAKLEAELALYKSFSEEVKKSQGELDSLVQDFDEDVESMQSTIFSLAGQLEKRNASIQELELENKELQRNKEKLEQLQTANIEIQTSIDKMETTAVKNIDDTNTLTVQREIQKLLED